MADSWLSNTYLVADEDGGTAVLIDAGGPVAPLLEAIDERGLSLTHVLLTHHHHDHVAELGEVLERHPDVEVLAHPDEREAIMGVTGTIEPGDKLTIGGLEVEAIHTPGHTGGMLNFLVDGTDLYTGDTLFKGSVGGVRAPPTEPLKSVSPVNTSVPFTTKLSIPAVWPGCTPVSYTHLTLPTN